jgi:hypothetical protein
MSFLPAHRDVTATRRTRSYDHGQRDDEIEIASSCDFADREGDHNSRQVSKHDEQPYSFPALRRHHASSVLTQRELPTSLHHGLNHPHISSTKDSIAKPMAKKALIPRGWTRSRMVGMPTPTSVRCDSATISLAPCVPRD